MKKINEKKYKEKKMIDDEKTHHQILFELGILDDLENWELFKKQEQLLDKIDSQIDINTYFKYVKVDSDDGKKIFATMKLQEELEAKMRLKNHQKNIKKI